VTPNVALGPKMQRGKFASIKNGELVVPINRAKAEVDVAREFR